MATPIFVTKISTVASIVLLILMQSVYGDESSLPASHSITPCLYATGFEYADGLEVDASGALFASNYLGNGRIGRIAADGTAGVFCDLATIAAMDDRPALPAGLALDRHGRLIVADIGAGRLLRVSSTGDAVEVLADRCEGIRFGQVDDVAIDPKGNIYFTDTNGSSLRSPVGSVFRYDILAGQVSQIATGFANPSGLAVSPDGKLLCVAERDLFRLVLYDLTSDGRATNRRVLIAFPTENEDAIIGGTFGPTGLMFDRQDHIFAAMGSGSLINVVELATGNLVRQYDAGGGKVTNLFLVEDWIFCTISSKEAVFCLDLTGENRHWDLESASESTDDSSSPSEETPDTNSDRTSAETPDETSANTSEQATDSVPETERATDAQSDVSIKGESSDGAPSASPAPSSTIDTTETGSPSSESPRFESESSAPASEATDGGTSNPPDKTATATEDRDPASITTTSSGTTSETAGPSVDNPNEDEASKTGIDSILDEATLRSHLPTDPALYNSLHEALQRESE